MISYKPLMRMLLERNMKKTDLLEFLDISTTTLTKLSKNEPVNLTVIDKACKAFQCRVEDIIEFVDSKD